MEKLYDRIVNYNVSVKEVDNKIIFLRKLVKGGSEHSFGIHVAKLAGMPKSIVSRANVILKQLETDNRQASVGSTDEGSKKKGKGDLSHHLKDIKPQTADGMQLSIFQLDDPVLCQIRDEINNIDVNNLTPLEALNKLNEIKKILKGKS